jgi:hypothetical protein
MTMRSITAAFDSRADAESAEQQLAQLGVVATEIRIPEQGARSEQTNADGPAHEGMWAHIKHMFLPDEDRSTYEESMRRGCFVLTVSVDDDLAAAAIETLESSNAVDLEQRQTEWRASGWSGDSQAEARDTAQAASATDDVIPVVEERLSVGKREVKRGGARVRSFVAEDPAQAEASERLGIDPRPVSAGPPHAGR